MRINRLVVQWLGQWSSKPRIGVRVLSSLQRDFIMYEEHLKRLEYTFGKFTEFPEATPLEKCILLMKENNCSYKVIMSKLGNPSKKIIRDTILKYKPELLEQTNVPVKSEITNEKRLIGLLKKFNKYQFDLDEFDLCDFKIENNCVTFNTEYNDFYIYKDLDERTQLSILYNVAKLLNVDIKTNEFKPDN